MAFGQVDDVDVIPDTGSVDGLVIVSEDAEEWEFANRDLSDIWHEVIWEAIWIFAKKSGWVSADWVEVSKQADVEVLVCFGGILKDSLNHDLGLAIWVGGTANWVGFIEWNPLWHAIDCGG